MDMVFIVCCSHRLISYMQQITLTLAENKRAVPVVYSCARLLHQLKSLRTLERRAFSEP